MRPGALRSRVLWFGATPPAELGLALTSRRLDLQEAKQSQSANQWSGVRTVIAIPSLGNSELLHQHAADLIFPALQHGVKVIAYANLEDIDELAAWKKSVPYRDRIQVFARNVSTQDIAETIARHDPGPPYNPLLEVEGGGSLDAEEMILLRRAFYDCKRISLDQLPGGRTADVYCGYVVVQGSIVGPRPLPFFVKFGRRHKVILERRHYAECANNYIPFYLRPNLDDSRFAEGYDKAVLVGNFVEHSEPLIDVVKRGAGQAALSSLFENSLRGWRLQAYYSSAPVITSPIAVSMKGAIHGATKQWRLDQVDRRAELAAQRHGATLDRLKLAALLDGLPARAHRVGFSHGDLHGKNVMVRGSDAIVIDLASVDSGPLAADPASLDVSLGLSDAGLAMEVWQKFVDDLYSFESLTRLPLPRNETEAAHWLWNSIRHVRKLAIPDCMHSHEYATAVSVQLLRRLALPKGEALDEERRIYGFVLAERLALKLDSLAAAYP